MPGFACGLGRRFSKVAFNPQPPTDRFCLITPERNRSREAMSRAFPVFRQRSRTEDLLNNCRRAMTALDEVIASCVE